MPATKVLVVDDSITMRALFTSALEKSRDLVVVGAAADAMEAADMIRSLKPDVLTLDVEMPGKTGIEFLEELMRDKPIPVVMLSTLTQKGADVSLRAIELGAVDCFPKPTRATPDEFDKISDKLCKLVLTAAKTNVRAKLAASAKAQSKLAAAQGYQWDGTIVGVAAGMGGFEALGRMLAVYPENCPPTILVNPMEEGLAVPFAAKLNAAIAPTVKIANADGLPLEPGTVYLAADMHRHVALDRWPGGMLRLVERDPVSGCRPSADLLFVTLAKTAAAKAHGVILSAGGTDGAGGLQRLREAGARTYCQDAATALIHEVAANALARNAVEQQLPPDEIGLAILASAQKQAAA